MDFNKGLSLLKERINDDSFNERLCEDLLLLACRAEEKGFKYESEYEHSMLIKASRGGRLNKNSLESVINYVKRYDNNALKELMNTY